MRGAFTVLVVLIVGVGGCATRLTPAQSLVYEQFDACRGEGPTVRLAEVRVNGQFTLEGRHSHIQLVKRCLSEQFGYERWDPRIREQPTEPGA